MRKVLFEGSDTEYTYNFESENSSYTFSKAFPGIEKWLQRKYLESSTEKVREELESYMIIETCPDCEGDRLCPYARHVEVGSMRIMDFCRMPLDEAYAFMQKLKLSGQKQIIAEKLLKEINARLSFLLNVGLSYLTLNRGAATLSGGESQRIR